MTITVKLALPLVVSIVGAIVFTTFGNSRPGELGRLAFATGLVAFLLATH